MCEKRIKKIRKGSQLARLREARRFQRLRSIPSPTPAEEAPPQPIPIPVRMPIPIPVRMPIPQAAAEKAQQNRVILNLAWKTIVLMQKNKLIQQKIIALQRETSEFVASVMSHPENRQRYLEHVRLYGPGFTNLKPTAEAGNMPLKLEPNV